MDQLVDLSSPIKETPLNGKYCVPHVWLLGVPFGSHPEEQASCRPDPQDHQPARRQGGGDPGGRYPGEMIWKNT